MPSNNDYADWYQQLMDEVQFGSGAPRLPIPYRAIPGPQFDPKDVPILPARPSGQLHFDPSYSTENLRYLAGARATWQDYLNALFQTRAT